MSLSFIPYPQSVRGIVDDQKFSQRLLDRIIECLDECGEENGSIIFRTQGVIPAQFARKFLVVRIQGDEQLATRSFHVRVQNGSCRLTVSGWMRFLNRDSDLAIKEDGILLLLGTARRHIPFPRTTV